MHNPTILKKIDFCIYLIRSSLYTTLLVKTVEFEEISYKHFDGVETPTPKMLLRLTWRVVGGVQSRMDGRAIVLGCSRKIF